MKTRRGNGWCGVREAGFGWAVGVLLLSFGSGGCLDDPATDDLPALGSIELAATVCADGATIDGIDVSHWNSTIDWGRVAAGGVEFAYIKASQGTSYVDDKFAQNWSGARGAGIARGAYHFFCPKMDGTAQADQLLAVMGTLGDGDLPPALDVETCSTAVCGSACDWVDVDCHTIVTNIHLWVDRIAAVTGRTPVIYTGWGVWEGPVCSSDELAGVDLWVANWGVSCPLLPDAWSDWKFWQTNVGTMDGVPGEVDLDVFNGDLDALRAYTGGGGTVGPSCGDGSCNGGETCATCEADCGSCTVGPSCGDGSCNGGETCATCETDCGPCDPGPVPGECAALGPAGGIIDELDPCWAPVGPDRWDPESPEGYGGHLFWVAPTAGPSPQNWAFWNIELLEAGWYRVEAYTEGAFADASVRSAAYVVNHGGRMDRVVVDQSALNGWAPLGTFEFAAGRGQFVRLDDVPAYAGEGEIVLFDAVRLTRVADPGGPDADADADADADPAPDGSTPDDPGGGGYASGCSVASGMRHSPGIPACLLGLASLALLLRRRGSRRSSEP
jgi:GH25 family lysozyme M1 (1,4-beta-N-acetylmuramidase)